MTDDELKMIIERHEKWLNGKDGGERANLCRANLCGANLSGAILNSAILYCANLNGANLCGADLCDADLCGATMCGADLFGASLCYADLCNAILCGADLQEANLCNANLHALNLCDANLCGAENVPFIPMACPDSGSFTGWKKAHDMIVKLQIPEDAKRSSATGRKCRCDKAVVLAIESLSGSPVLHYDDILGYTNTGVLYDVYGNAIAVQSDHDENFIYRIGETVSVNDFNTDRFRECAPGIHFFINRQEVVEYN